MSVTGYKRIRTQAKNMFKGKGEPLGMKCRTAFSNAAGGAPIEKSKG